MALAIPSIPLAYGDARAEHAALLTGCGIDRVAARAVLEVAADEVPALAAAATRRLAARAAADAAVALLVDARGLLRGAATLVALPGGRMLVDVTNRRACELLQEAGVHFDDHRGDVIRMRLSGPQAAEVLAAAAGAAPERPGDVRADLAAAGSPFVAVRTRPDGIAIYCDLDHARALWDRLRASGAIPVGSVALETRRVEQAEPCPERDFPGPRPANAAGLPGFGPDDGEERLVLVEHEGVQVLPKAVVRAGGEEVGSLRTAAVSPTHAGRPLALVVVPVALAAPDVELELDAGARRVAAVVRAPVALPASCHAPNY